MRRVTPITFSLKLVTFDRYNKLSWSITSSLKAYLKWVWYEYGNTVLVRTFWRALKCNQFKTE